MVGAEIQRAISDKLSEGGANMSVQISNVIYPVLVHQGA